MNALIVFAKVPEPGKVKTRLSPLLTPEEAAGLYEAFLRDALAQYAGLDVACYLYLGPPVVPLPEGMVPKGVQVRVQKGPDLGQRMLQAFLETFASGHQRIVIIGTDHPTLPTAFIEQAFETLAEPRSICIGPSEDGGYYLLGMNAFYPRVFEDMTYSHPHVFEQTLRRVQDVPATLTILPAWYDVDTPAALRRLLNDIPDSPEGPARTREMLATLDLPSRFLKDE